MRFKDAYTLIKYEPLPIFFSYKCVRTSHNQENLNVYL